MQRLLVRGLIVAGTGDTEYDALYDLLACRFIIPIGAAWPLRVLSFLKLTFLEGISWKITRRLFHVDTRSACEKKSSALPGRHLSRARRSSSASRWISAA